MLETINENNHYENNDDEVEPRRRKKVEKSFGRDFMMFVLEGKPQTFKEAVNSIESLM